MTKEKKISIIISTYNKEKFIKNTIKSCLNQSYKNYEIIVVDTGSTDKTKKIIKKFNNNLFKEEVQYWSHQSNLFYKEWFKKI